MDAFSLPLNNVLVDRIQMLAGGDVGMRRIVMLGDLTLNLETPRYLSVDTNGSARNMLLPPHQPSPCLAFHIVNRGAQTLTVKNHLGTTVLAVAAGGAASYISDGVVWIATASTPTIV